MNTTSWNGKGSEGGVKGVKEWKNLMERMMENDGKPTKPQNQTPKTRKPPTKPAKPSPNTEKKRPGNQRKGNIVKKPDKLSGNLTLNKFLELKKPALCKVLQEDKGFEQNTLCNQAASISNTETRGMTTEAKFETGHDATQLQTKQVQL